MESRINLAQDCPVYFSSWIDKKPVHLLHTFPTSFDTISRNTKNRSTQLYEPIEITRPTAVGTYNNGMGGTDLHHQLIAYYRIALRTKRWPRKIYAHLLNIVGVNTHRLYVSHFNLQRKDQYFELLPFLRELILQLAFPNGRDINPIDLMKAPVTARTSGGGGDHEPMMYRCKTFGGSKQVDFRKNCLICDKKVPTCCYTCKAFLCFRTSSDPLQTCWNIYHSVSDIELDLYKKSRIKDKKERQELQKKRKVIDERLQSLRRSRTVEYVSE
jgi:hypothetical protein